MAGYIMTLDNMEAIEQCVSSSTYNSNLSVPKKNAWLKIYG